MLRYLAAIVLIVGVLAWQGDVFTRKLDPGEVADGRRVADPSETVQVREVEWPVVRRMTGTLMPRETVELGAQIMGEVTEVTVEAGDRVEAGQVLLRVARDLPSARRAEAEAALEMAQAELQGAERLLSSLEEAAQANAIPRTEAIDARRVRDLAARAVDRRRAMMDAAETRLGYTTLSSPLSGVVIDTLRDPGDLVMPGHPVALLYDPDRMEVVVSAPSHQADLYTPGREWTCKIDALGKTVSGTVRTIVPRTDPATRTLMAKLEMTPPAGALPGMYVEVQVEDRLEPTLVVPDTAIGSLRGLRYVREVNAEARVSHRLVRLGRRVGNETEVLGGLEAGERVMKQYEGDSGGDDGE